MSDSSAVLILKQGQPSSARQWSLGGAVWTIGRVEGNDIVLAATEVSRQHAILREDRGRWVLEDLDSRNGTFVNGKPLSSPCRLSDGDLIQIATQYRLLFSDSDVTAMAAIETTAPPASSTPPVASGLDAPEASSQRLVIDSKARRIWVLGQELSPPLSASQYMLLELMYQRVGELVTREDIAKVLWPKASGIVSEQAIDSLIFRLRQRLAQLDPEHTYIATVRGHGFRLEPVD